VGHEQVETRERVANGTTVIGLDRAGAIDGGRMGHYELEVHRPAERSPGSLVRGGWYVEPKALTTRKR
jgi:hypothetical protein